MSAALDDDPSEPTLAEVVESLTRAVNAISKSEVPRLDDVLPALSKLTQIQAIVPIEKKQRFFEQLAVYQKLGWTPRDSAAALQKRLDVSRSTFYRWRDEAVALGIIPNDSQEWGSAWENGEAE